VFLKVTLVEELFEKQVSPLMGDLEGPALGGDISCVQTDFNQLLL